MLYISTLIEEGSANCRFGFGDDIAIIRVGKNPSEVVKVAQEEADRIVKLAATHMIKFDPSKSELLVIGRGPKKKFDLSSLSVQVGEQLITPSPHIRWLGVCLDAQLIFKQHIHE